MYKRHKDVLNGDVTEFFSEFSLCPFTKSGISELEASDQLEKIFAYEAKSSLWPHCMASKKPQEKIGNVL